MPTSLVPVLTGGGFVICWSSGFVGGQLATEVAVAPLSLFAWRFFIATAAAAGWWLLSQVPGLSSRVFLSEMAVGSMTVGAYLLTIIIAIDLGVNPGVAALIGAMQPLLATILARRFLGEVTAVRQWCGMSIATVGVGLCVADDMHGGSAAPAWAYGLPLLAVCAVSGGSVLSARLPHSPRLVPALTAQLLAAALVFATAGLIAGGGSLELLVWEPDTLVALAWLIVFSTFGGYGFFVASLRHLGVTTTSTLVYLTPPVTLLWASFMFGEYPGPSGYVGMAVASAGVFLSLPKHRVARAP